MIEVNLLPGGKRRPARGRRRLRIPGFDLKRLKADKVVVGGGIVAVAALGYAAYLFFGTQSRLEELEVSIQEQATDSARFAALVEQTNALSARRDSIAARVAVIQEIDQDRFVWPHIFDEVARAMPEYLWLERIQSSGTEPFVTLQIEARAGSLRAVTIFLQALEASAFLANVQLQGTEQVREVDQFNVAHAVYDVTYTATYRPPPMELLQTEPLFDDAIPTEPPAAEPDTALTSGEEVAPWL